MQENININIKPWNLIETDSVDILLIKKRTCLFQKPLGYVTLLKTCCGLACLINSNIHSKRCWLKNKLLSSKMRWHEWTHILETIGLIAIIYSSLSVVPPPPPSIQAVWLCEIIWRKLIFKLSNSQRFKTYYGKVDLTTHWV